MKMLMIKDVMWGPDAWKDEADKKVFVYEDGWKTQLFFPISLIFLSVLQ